MNGLTRARWKLDGGIVYRWAPSGWFESRFTESALDADPGIIECDVIGAPISKSSELTDLLAAFDDVAARVRARLADMEAREREIEATIESINQTEQ